MHATSGYQSLNADLVVVMDMGYGQDLAEQYSAHMIENGWVTDAVIKDKEAHKAQLESALLADLPDEMEWPMMIHAHLATKSINDMAAAVDWLGSRQGVKYVAWDKPWAQALVQWSQDWRLWQMHGLLLWIITEILVLGTAWLGLYKQIQQVYQPMTEAGLRSEDCKRLSWRHASVCWLVAMTWPVLIWLAL